MFSKPTSAALLLLVSASLAAAQQTCNATQKCGSANPCCSEYGFCFPATSEYCLGGCNPLFSNAPSSCKPNAVCQSGTYSFADQSRILTNFTNYDGNVSKWDWTVDQGNIIPGPDGKSTSMTLDTKNNGTRISSTRYVHYGQISAKVMTGKWPGVVTAFITMSDIRDEIDWEWPGTNVTSAQTNFFWEGVIPSRTDGTPAGGLSDTSSNYHIYEIDWQPDTLTFSIDGATVRTVKKSDTQDAGGADGFKYPSTPARIQLSIWPGGAPTEAPGTIQWAGGPIDFSNPDYAAAGHFYATVAEVDVQCADPQTPGNGTTGYVYGANATGQSPQVAFTNASVLLAGNGAGRAMSIGAGSWAAAGLALVGALATLL